MGEKSSQTRKPNLKTILNCNSTIIEFIDLFLTHMLQ